MPAVSPSPSPLNPQTPKGGVSPSSALIPTSPNISEDSPPPTMKTFIYSPEVRVVIDHLGVMYDVSNDIVNCSLRRAESSAATFSMTLSNRKLRYTGGPGGLRFSRMDRIVVYMKRTKMVQVFSGYLDTVPYKQLYPGTVNFKATCTIKRLMHTWWNPSLPKSQELMSSQEPLALMSPSKDSGLGSLLRQILVQVGNWKSDNIHIQNFPTSFFDLLVKQALENKQVNNEAVEKFRRMLLGSQGLAAPGEQAGFNSNAGSPGPQGPPIVGAVGGNTAFYVAEIIAACDLRGMGPLVSDNNLSAGLAAAGQAGANSSPGMMGDNVANQKAWEQVTTTNLATQEANRNSDAAILGVACAAVETGGGVAIRNLYNPIVPGSQECTPNDGPGTDHDSCGIFQQRNMSAWGTVQQRMNPRQAAGMFFSTLTSMVPDWRNQQASGQGGAAITAVQRCQQDLAYKYQLAIPWATAQVLAARGVTAAATGNTSGAAPSTATALVTGAASLTPSAAALPTRAGKPVPDSEGAINWGMTQIGQSWDFATFIYLAFRSINVEVPKTSGGVASYSRVPPNAIQRGDLVALFGSDRMGIWLGDGTMMEGSNSVGGTSAKGTRIANTGKTSDTGGTVTPGTASLEQRVLQQFPGAGVDNDYRAPDWAAEHSSGTAIDFSVNPGGSMGTITDAGQAQGSAMNQWILQQPGVQYTIWQGKQWNPDGSTSPNSGQGVTAGHYDHIHARLSQDAPAGNISSDATSVDGNPIHGVRIVPVPIPPTSMSGIYRIPGVDNGGPDPTAPFTNPVNAGSGQAPGSLSTQGGAGGATQEPIAQNLFAYMFTQQFLGPVGMIWPGQKAFLDGQPLIQTIVAVCNAGLRKFMSGPNGDFIAYYPDYWGLDQKPAVLTLQDIELKDVRIDFSDDPLTTHVYVNGDLSQMGQFSQVEGWLETAGVATVENEWLWKRLRAVAPGDLENMTGEQLMRKFGVRPLKQTYAMAGSYELELLLACQVFMEKWAQQYQTTISMTFMPDLFPGMRVDLAGHNLTVYVTDVTHSCDFQNGFSTTATIMAPANPNALSLLSQMTDAMPQDASTEDITKAFTTAVGGPLSGAIDTSAAP